MTVGPGAAGTGTAARAARGRRSEPGPHYRWIALSNTTLGVLMATINQSILLIALPDIFRGIGMNPLAASNTSYLLWMMMGFLVVSAVLVVSFGRLGDMFGRVRMYNMGFAVFTVASIALTVTWMHGVRAALWLIIWRVIQGIGGAFLFANSTAILTDAFPLNKRGTALGINSIAAIAGSFIGLLLGGVLAPYDWHLIFLVSAPIGAFGTVWAYFMLHDISARQQARMDWWGNILFGAGLIAILVGITYGLMPYGTSAMGWGNPWVLAAIGGGLAALVIFLIVETKVADPLFRLSLFRIRAFAAGNLANLMLALGRGGMQFIIIIWLQGVWLPLHGYSFADTPLWAGIYMVPLTIGFLISAPLSGVISDRFGQRAFTVGGAALTGVSFLLLMLLPVDFPYWQFGLVLAFNGFSSGLFVSPNRAEIMNSVPASQRGAAGGMIATFQNAAFVLSIGIFFSLIVAGLSATLPWAMSGGLVAQGVPAQAAHQVASLPPIAVLFAAFLGYSPMRQLLGPLLAHMPAAHAAYLTGRQFFPHLIAGPFHSGLSVAFWFAIAANLVGAVASLFTGRRRRGRAEPVGAELAGVAAEGSLGPSELVGGAQQAPAAGNGNGQPALDGVLAGQEQRERVQLGAGLAGPGNGQRALPAAGPAPLTSPSAVTPAAGGPVADRPAVCGQVLLGDGAPADGATVTFLDVAGCQAARERTGPGGSYHVALPGPGTYTLVVMASGQEPHASTISVGDQPAERDVVLAAHARLTGTARTAAGAAIGDARVILLDAGGNTVAATITGPDGSYAFESLPGGQYTVIASGYPPVASALTVTPSQAHCHDVELGHPPA